MIGSLSPFSTLDLQATQLMQMYTLLETLLAVHCKSKGRDTRVPFGVNNIAVSYGTTVTHNLQSSPMLRNIGVEDTLGFPQEQSTSITLVNMTILSSGYVIIGIMALAYYRACDSV